MIKDIIRLFEKQSKFSKTMMALIVVGTLMLYSSLNIVYRNYQINRQIKGLEQEIAYLQENNIEQRNRILYYSTDAFAEKILRQKLNHQKEGERVYALARKDPEREKLVREQQKYQEREEKKANILKWWDFFFKH